MEKFFARRLAIVEMSKEEGEVEEEDIFVLTSHIVSYEEMNVTQYMHLPFVMINNL
jgi:F420-0:gamma-glutamyl ligase